MKNQNVRNKYGRHRATCMPNGAFFVHRHYRVPITRASKRPFAGVGLLNGWVGGGLPVPCAIRIPPTAHRWKNTDSLQ